MKFTFLVAAIVSCVVSSGPALSAAPPSSKKAPPAQSGTKKTNMQYPFINGHYALTGVLKTNGYRSDAPTVVVVDKGSHFTHILQLQHLAKKDEIVRVMTVSNAVGNEDKPTPPGRYLVAMKKKFPVWIPTKEIDPKQKPVPPYNETHKNPLGVAAIYLNKYELALHGTNEPKMIRKSVSHGCIRHSNADISRIFGMVKQNTPVYIVRQFRGTVLNRSDFIKAAPPQDKPVAGSDATTKKSEVEATPFPAPTKHKRVVIEETC
jgi:lipoprotein-anchoring transpeptidase ErfK/SrfK